MKIVIVGGGTAGWLAALMLTKTVGEHHEITLIESSSIGSIGVGEGSTGFLRGVINNEVWDYGCNEIDFMRHSKAVPKLGILFKDWQGINKEYMEPIDGPFYSSLVNSYPMLLSYKALGAEESLCSRNGILIKNNLSNFYLENEKLSHDNNHAHHFDSKLAAEYFEKICIKDITKIDDKIQDFKLNKHGAVDYLIISNNRKIYGDFFIDASGFSRIFSKKMNNPFIKFDEITLNSAIPFRLEKSFFKNPDFFYTVSWAQKYGWMWMIPKSDSVGCGYIYDDNFIDENGAKKEIEEKLKTEIDVIKKISFVSGRIKYPWKKNVLSIGLSSNFLEPLEATSIHGTIAQLNNFIFNYLKSNYEDTVIDPLIEKYNDETSKMVENFKDFILYHYCGVRDDTDFWKQMNTSAHNNKTVNKIFNISKQRLLNNLDLEVSYGMSSPELFNWVSCSLNHFSSDTAKKELQKMKRLDFAKQEESDLHKYLESFDWISNKDLIDYIF